MRRSVLSTWALCAFIACGAAMPAFSGSSSGRAAMSLYKATRSLSKVVSRTPASAQTSQPNSCTESRGTIISAVSGGMLPPKETATVRGNSGVHHLLFGGSTCVRVTDAFVFFAQVEMATKLAGRWEPAVENNSPWMTGMTISPDGTFRTKWNGDRHLVTDGRVLAVRGSDGLLTINLKRTCEGQIF